MATELDTKRTVAGHPADPTAPLLNVENLHVEFRLDAGIVKRLESICDAK